MAEVYREVERVPDTVDTPAEHGMTILERLIYLVSGIVIAILAIRFLLALLGANRGAGFSDFIYNISHPLVAPFFGLFNVPNQFEGHRFEWSTLIAIVVYAILMAIAARLVTLGSRRRDV